MALEDSLDDLTIKSLELVQEKVELTVQLENLVREGHIELAKARYIRGKESIGMLQVPKDQGMRSLFDLERSNSNGIGSQPRFEISLRTNVEKDKKKEEEEDSGSGSKNPIEWFGVLVPRNLRNAQKKFQESVYLAVRIANLQVELDKVQLEFQQLRQVKVDGSSG